MHSAFSTPISASSLANCHFSTPMANVLPISPPGNDIRPFVQSWSDYARAIPVNRFDTLCNYNARNREQMTNVVTELWANPLYPMSPAGKGSWNLGSVRQQYHTLGCFLNTSRTRIFFDGSGNVKAMDNGVMGNSWKVDLQTPRAYLAEIYKIMGKASRADVDFIRVIGEALTKTRGMSLFSNRINEFGFYFILYSIAASNGASLSELQEHIIYMYWTFLNQSQLSSAQKLRYYRYQRRLSSTLPRQISSTANVLSLDILKSSCPAANQYVTVGCLISIALNCEVDFNVCKPSYQSVRHDYRPALSGVITGVCGDSTVKSSFSRICNSEYRRW